MSSRLASDVSAYPHTACPVHAVCGLVSVGKASKAATDLPCSHSNAMQKPTLTYRQPSEKQQLRWGALAGDAYSGAPVKESKHFRSNVASSARTYSRSYQHAQQKKPGCRLAFRPRVHTSISRLRAIASRPHSARQ